MTHFVVAATGTAGDVYPFIELCQRLKRSPDKVTLVTSQYFKSQVLRSGVSFHKLGTLQATKTLFDNPDLWTEEKGFAALWKGCIEPNLDVLRKFVAQLDEPEDIVLICHFNVLPLADIARLGNRNMKIISCYLSPGTIRSRFGRLNIGTVSIDDEYPDVLKEKLFAWIDKNYFNAGVLPKLNRHRVNLGLPPVDNLLPYLQRAADAYFTLFPSWYRKAERDWPKPLVEGSFLFHRSITVAAPSERIRKFLKENGAPVLFTAGTANSTVSSFFRDAKQATENLGIGAIFLTKRREQLPGDLGKNILWLRYFDLDSLMQISSICVSHGGIGTVAAAMRVGLPQIIVPFAHDQFDNSRIVFELGIGMVIPAKQLTTNNLSTNIRAILHSDQIKAHCRTVAKRLEPKAGSEDFVEKLRSNVWK